MIKKQYEYLAMIVLWCIAFSAIVWRYCMFSWFDVPLGYDPWLYRAISLVYTHWFDNISVIWSFIRPKWLHHEPLWWIGSALLSKLWVALDTQLWLWRYIVSVLSLVVTAYWTKYITKNSIIARWVLVIGSLSVIQWEAWNMMYFKQIIAQMLWLWLLFFYKEKKYYTIAIILFIMLWLHRHTSLFFSLVVISDMIYQYYKTRKIDKNLVISILWGIGLGMMWYIPMFSKLILQYLYKVAQSTDGSWPQWVFFTVSEYISFSIPWILGALSYIIMMRKKEKTLLYRWVMIGLIWIATGFINANRQEILTDPLLIIATCIVLREYRLQYKKIIIALALWCLIRQWSYFVWYTTETKPLISSWLFHDISQIKTLVPSGATIMIEDSAYTPWIMWYTERNWISPGLSDANVRNLEQRNTRRSTSSVDKRCNLIQNDYKKYLSGWLYFWTTDCMKTSSWCMQKIIVDSAESCLFKIE